MATAKNKSHIADRLRAARMYAVKTQSQVAAALGLKRPSVSQYESHATTYNIPSEAIVKWAEFCGIQDAGTLLDDSLSVTDLTEIWSGNRPYHGKRVIPSRPQSPSLDVPTDSRVDAWRSAVQFECVNRDLNIGPAFNAVVHLAGVDLVAPFLHGRKLCALAGWDADIARLYSTSVARLLLLENAVGRGAMVKHLILLKGDMQEKGTAVELVKPVCGVHIHVVNSIHDAADILMA